MLKVYGMSVDWEFKESVVQYREENTDLPDQVILANSIRFWLAFFFEEADRCRSDRVKSQSITRIKWKAAEDDFTPYE
jgi:hypothetical protein